MRAPLLSVDVDTLAERAACGCREGLASVSVHPVNLAQLTDEVRANRAASREPLTRERSRAWLDADADRIGDVETYRVGDEERAALYALLDDVDDQRMWRALSSLLVDAAAGRVR